jgi:hypothetical protein
MFWRRRPPFAKHQPAFVREGAMTSEAIQLFLSLAIGFAFAGMLATGYQLATSRALSFRLLESGPKASTLAAVPFLAFAAPFIIMRNTIRGRLIEGRSVQLVMISTVVAGLWSLMCGTVATMVLSAMLQI